MYVQLCYRAENGYMYTLTTRAHICHVRHSNPVGGTRTTGVCSHSTVVCLAWLCVCPQSSVSCRFNHLLRSLFPVRVDSDSQYSHANSYEKYMTRYLLKGKLKDFIVRLKTLYYIQLDGTAKIDLKRKGVIASV